MAQQYAWFWAQRSASNWRRSWPTATGRANMWSGRIVLASADRHAAQQVAQSIGVSRLTVWGWQQCFAESGVEGLLRDKTRKPGKAPIVAETSADRHIEFIRFLNAHRARGPAGKVIHAVLNNYATPAGRTAKREIGRAAAAAAQNVNAYPRSTLCGV